MRREFDRKATGRAAGKVIAAFLLAAGLSACHFNVHIYHETIVNDTPRTVIARHCDNYCSASPLTFTLSLTLSPGQSANVNVEGGTATWFSLTDTGGAHLGCLNLGISPSEGLKVPVSTAASCP